MTRDSADYSAYRFLIADDKPFLRSLVHGMLSRCKAGDIAHAADGAAAIDMLREAKGTIDCVLCDWNMEPVDGLELLRSIRSGNIQGTPRDLRFIMLTGHADSEVVETALQLDIHGYLVKPVSMEKLTRAIDNAFAKPLALKREETYLAKSTIELPNLAPGEVKRIPSWVLMSKMREKNRAEMLNRLELIHRAGAESRVQKRFLINEERLDLDRIVPGRILAEDIFTEHGKLLLAAGSVLSSKLLARLHDLSALGSDAIRFTVGDYED